MNNKLYRLIFNRIKGVLVVVSEIAGAGRARGASRAVRAQRSVKGQSIIATIRPLTLAIGLACGVIQPVQAGIVADPNAAGNQQPVITNTASGLPQVNIQTPNADGVSRNQYSQFNVDKQGAILNNSARNTQSQLAGMVAANPLLARGEAKVILNEVNSATPAQLNGFIEVAGRRAEVVIASPAGISCSSCGFINASSTTLAAGKARVEQGRLSGFDVDRGTITIDGAGYNDNQSQYTRLIGRAVKINARLQAQDLKMTTGANLTDAEGNVQQTKKTSNQDVQFALDVAAVGGMYANKIRMTGTEQGVGVRNAGEIGAAVGDVQLSASGDLDNTGVISANTNSNLQIQGTLRNQGTLQGGATSQIRAGQQIDNSGSINVAGNSQINSGLQLNNSGSLTSVGDLTITASQSVTNQHQIVAGRNLNITSHSLSNTQDAVLAAGVDSQGQLTQNGNLQLKATEQMQLHGRQLAHDNLTLQAHDLNLQGSRHSANHIDIKATGDIDTSNAQLLSSHDLTLHAGGQLNNSSGLLSAETVQFTAQGLNNQAGQIQQSGDGDLTLNFVDGINNQLGTIASNGNALTLTGSAIDNQHGRIQHAGKGSLTLNTDNYQGQQGTLLSNGQLVLQGGHYVMDNSQTSAANIDAQLTDLSLRYAQMVQRGAGTLQFTLQGDLDNQNGILSAQQLNITANNLNNQNGQIEASQSSELHIQQTLDNQNGSLRAAEQLQLATGQLLNQQGQISGYQQLGINSQQINNKTGQLLAGKTLTIDSDSVSGDGKIVSDGDIALTLQSDFTQTGTLQALGNIDFTTSGRVINHTQILAGKQLHLQSRQLDNLDAAEITAGSNWLQISQSLNNQGLIDGSLTHLSADTLLNEGKGRIYGDDLAINATTLYNHADSSKHHAAVIAGRHTVNIGVNTLDNADQSLIYSGDSLNIGGTLDSALQASGQATTVTNRGASLSSQGDMQLAANEINNLNTNLKTHVVVVALEHHHEVALRGSTDRHDWRDIVKTEKDQYDVPTVYLSDGTSSDEYYEYDYDREIQQTQVISSEPGKIQSGGSLLIKGQTLNNNDSQIVAGGTLQAQVTNLNNRVTLGTRILTDKGTETYHYPKKTKHTFGPTRTSPGTKTRDYLPDVQQQDINPGVALWQQNSQQSVADQTLTNGSTAQRIEVPGVNGRDGEDAQTVIRTEQRPVQLPTSSLFIIQPGTASQYLVQTDPRFTNQRQWLGSDYMQNALLSDPSHVHKRLGDGYYEQQLIREQLIQLSGQRYLGNYQNDEEQFKALMDNGIAFARQYHLTPGVALTPAQMALMTGDMVWLVEQTVRLPDGRTEQVLVPQVYVKLKKGDISGDGALLAGNQVQFNVNGKLANQGSLFSKNGMDITSGHFLNQGQVQGEDLRIRATENIDNIGGTITGGQSLQLEAGHNLRSESTLSGLADNQHLNRVAGIYVKQDQGQLSLKAGNDLILKGTQVAATGHDSQVAISAGHDIQLDTVTTTQTERSDWDKENYRHLSQTQELGSEISGANLSIQAGHDISARAAQVNADKALNFTAGHDIRLSAGQEQAQLTEHSRQQSQGLLSGLSQEKQDEYQTLQARSSQLTGETVNITAGHDLSVSGSNVAGQGEVNLTAGHDVAIRDVTESRQSHEWHQEKRTGLMDSGGMGVSYGMQSQQVRDGEQQLTSHGSQIGSAGGDLHIEAGNRLAVTGSDLIAGKNMSLSGDSVTIRASENQSNQQHSTIQKQTGLTLGLGGSAGSLINNSVDQARNARQESNDRMAALSATQSALSGYQAYQAEQLAQTQNPAQGGLDSVGLNLSLGSQTSRSESHSTRHEAQGSSLNAGSNMSITARGGSQDTHSGDIVVSGSRATAGGSMALQASRDIDLNSAENSASSRSSNQSQGGSIGVGLSTQGLNASASGNQSRGHENSDSLSHTNSSLSAGQQLTLESGRDTTLTGATASGHQVKIDAGRDLTVSSEQDREDYQSRQSAVSGGLSVPIMGAGSGSASLNTSKDKMDSHYASVKEQSGIFAGEGGFDVHTGNHTQLNGGVIASTATADKNHLDTGTLGFSDIDNHADDSVSHQGMGISTGQFSGGASLAGITRGLASNAASSILSGLSDSGHADSTTHAAISEGSITVRDKANQQQDVNSLSRDTDHANQGLSPIFDKEKAQQRLAESQRLSEIGGQVADIVRTNGEIQAAKAKQDPSERAKAAEELKASGQAVTDTAIDNKITESVMQRYGTGSDLQRGIQAATAALQGLAGGNLTAAALDAASPYIAGLIHNATTTTDSQGHSEVNTAANLAAHALVNVAVALAEGGNSRDALSRASGAVSGEAIGMMAKAYYNKDAKDLTEQERQTVSALATAAAGLAGGLVGDSTASAATAAQAGKNAVENNYLSQKQQAQKKEELAECQSVACKAQTQAKWTAINLGQDGSFAAGMVAGVPAGLYDTIDSIVKTASNPQETCDALKSLFNSGDVLGNVSDAVKQSYIDRIDRMESQYQKAGTSGSFNAGVEGGKLVTDIAGLLAGGAGVVKGGAVLTEKVVAKTNGMVEAALKSSVVNKILKADRIGSGLKPDPTHRGASYLSREQLMDGKVFTIKGGDGIERKLLQAEGSFNDKKGIFEYIYDNKGNVTHQRFIEGGIISGAPNQRSPKVK